MPLTTTSQSIPSLDTHKTELVEMKKQGKTYREILTFIHSIGYNVSKRSLERQFQQWGAIGMTLPGTDEFITQLKDLYLHDLLSDTEIAQRIIDDEGRHPSARQIKRIRLKNGLIRRVNKADPQISAARLEATRSVVSHLITEGGGRSFGSRWAQTHLRRRLGHHARLLDVQVALREFDPVGVAQRNPRLRNLPLQRQENYVTAGPDEIWSCDGHDKLTRFGFQIYAAIDAYSRKLIWLYCGNANRSSICVLQQYLQAVKKNGICPRFLRTDKGGETILLAACHYNLFLEAVTVEGMVETDGMDLSKPECCFIWGSSPRNVRIERIWLQVRQEVTTRWGDLFTLIEKRSLYRSWCAADCVVMQFVFMPLVREELNQFVLDKNAHPIRRQKNRSYHISGIPNKLYEEGQRHGFPVHLSTVHEWESQISLFGRPRTPLHPSASPPF
jgi:hypothetical protein